MYFITGLSKAFEPFACTETESGYSYLNADPSITCWESDHITILLLDIIPLLIYLVGVPTVYSIILFYMCESCLRTAHATRRAVPRPTHLWHRVTHRIPKKGFENERLNSTFGFIWSRFEQHCYWSAATRTAHD